MGAFMIVGVVVGVALVMMLVERVRPGPLWPKVAGWWPRALLVNAGQVGAVALAGSAWDPWLVPHR